MERVKFLIKGFVTNMVFTTILFICAGRINYTQGWIFLSTNIIATLMSYLTIYQNSDLIKERSKPGEGIKSWDKLLLGLSALFYVIIIASAGFDSGRLNPSFALNWKISITGVVLTLIGQVIFLTARSQNKFFSSVVRIQKDRGHIVCDSGLYKIIRHPGYLGMIISLSGIPLMTTSVWSLIPTFMSVVFLVIRTALEDKTLMIELDGYDSYAGKTPYKLIPFVW
jgi:protein-S-isoprenylcysteine O-methyltransferase Ste14